MPKIADKVKNFITGNSPQQTHPQTLDDWDKPSAFSHQPNPNPLSDGASSMASPTSSPPQSEPTHFDDLLNEGQGAAGQPPAVMVKRDEFGKLFFAGFNVAHGVTGLKSLKLQEGDSAALECSGALYDTILDIPALHFMLQPSGKWLPRIVAIAAFSVPMARGVAQEVAERRKPAQPLNYSAAKTATKGAAPAANGELTPETLEKMNGA